MNDIEALQDRLSEKTEQARWALEQWNEAWIEFRQALIEQGADEGAGASAFGLAEDLTGLLDGFANMRERLIGVAVSDLDEL